MFAEILSSVIQTFKHCNPQSGVRKLVVGADYIKLIWVPDTFFVNEKTAQFHAATQVMTWSMRDFLAVKKIK